MRGGSAEQEDREISLSPPQEAGDTTESDQTRRKKDSSLLVPHYLLLSTGRTSVPPEGPFDKVDPEPPAPVIYNHLQTLTHKYDIYQREQESCREDKRTNTRGGTLGEEEKYVDF